ncbi:MAG: C25 family cysteine peptidase [Thermoplasmatota archaeon]
MKKCAYINKSIIGGIILLLILGSIPAISYGVTTKLSDDTVETINFVQYFSIPTIKYRENYCEILVEQASSVLTHEEKPMLPVFVKTFEFPFGTTIYDIQVSIGDVESIQLSKQVHPVPQKLPTGSINHEISIYSFSQDSYDELAIYPESWYSYHTGAGINKENQRVLFLIFHMYPTRYDPSVNLLNYAKSVELEISYEKNVGGYIFGEGIDFVIIAPEDFSDSLQPLVTHKNMVDLPTQLFFVEDIYQEYPGRDNPEQIKYFIKSAIEQWNIKYVLLVGDFKKIPIRHTFASPWEPDILSDLYYSDIYNDEYEFSCWDANENDKFGEIDHEGEDIDGVDLFADVHIGRLACVENSEVDVVVEKIINYEKNTYGSDWFHKVILAGGDTFPPFYHFAQPDVFEGEITNSYVAEALPDFESIFLWTSKHNLNAFTFNRAINKGAGFLSYAGHGFEHGWGTYRPNAMTDTLILYYMPFVRLLRNQNRLPIVFFDACLTAKLDFNISDLHNYYPTWIELIVRFTKVEYDTSILYPCFAWSMVVKEGGGAIATIGSTRLAYTWVNQHGVFAGAGYLDVSFFEAYEKGVTVGEMLTAAQFKYISNVGFDYFTIEEFILLGDPSLRVGGYPQ